MTPVSLDLRDRDVMVVGREDRARRAVARYRAAGARVRRVLGEHAARECDVRLPDFVAWVEGPSSVRDRLRESATRLRIGFLTDDPIHPTPRGHVTLVGAGPGDAGLMTQAGVRALAEADVVIHDRLGPRHVIAEYAPGAELIDVGKTPGHHSVPQSEIERLLLERANRGLRVVRFKGGDPFVFGRGGEELRACRSAGVPVTVLSGVTSAIAVPAAAGIPVTQRDVARSFTVVSGHVPLSEEELAHLVGMGGTIVVLMGIGTLPHLVEGLRRHGMTDGTPLAILENGFSAAQRVMVSTVGGIVERLGRDKPVSPAVIVIGDVVGAAGQVGWGPGEAAWEDGDILSPTRLRHIART